MEDYTKRINTIVENAPSFMEDSFDLGAFQAERAVVRRKPRSRLAIVLNLMLIVLLCLVGYQVYSIAKYYYDLDQSEVYQSDARDIFVNAQIPPPDVPLMTEPESALETPDETAEAKIPETGEEEAPEDLLPTPTPRPPLNISPDVVAQLSAKFENPDIIAYLDIPGTNISYPVAQGLDNSYYLYRGVDGRSNSAGSIFMDYECDPRGLTSRNYVIYGHNMKNGSMFHNLRYYSSDGQFFLDHPEVTLVFRDFATRWEIFAAYRVSTGFNYIQVFFKDDTEFLDLLDNIMYKAFIKSEVSLSAQDRLLTLSTCTNVGDTERLVINAKLVDVMPFD